MSLPASRTQASEPAPSIALNVAARRRGSILVIDDEPTITKAVRRILAPEHEVVALGSAARALERIVAGERFDVILCDLMMPEMTGIYLYVELTRLAAEQASRMIFLSGGAFTVRARAFLDQVPNQRIEKPFGAPYLRSLINDRIR